MKGGKHFRNGLVTAGLFQSQIACAPSFQADSAPSFGFGWLDSLDSAQNRWSCSGSDTREQVRMASNPDEHNVPSTPAPVDENDYEHLLEDYSHLAPPSEGELLQGRVVKITPKEVIVDFGYKIEGVVPIEQFPQVDGAVQIQPGDTIDVMIEQRHPPQPGGYILLSHEKAAASIPGKLWSAPIARTC